MIPFAEARAIVLEHSSPLAAEPVALERLLGRRLAAAVHSPVDIPFFDNSAMDGFGVRVADVAAASRRSPAELRLRGAVRAGDVPEGELAGGTAVKLLTGAPVPPGVEAVVVVEDTEERDGTVLVSRPARAGDNIRRKGEEFRTGDEVLPAGALATPAVVGLLASLGYGAFEAHRLPRVAVIVTGSELVQPGQQRGPAQVYDANSWSLLAALHGLGITEATASHARDELGPTRDQLAWALPEADVVLVSGGVSVGEYDLVKDACAELGVETRFWQVAIKPAKPTYFGTLDEGGRKKLVFGLPGNSVAALVAFHQLAKPGLLRLMGAPEVRPQLLPATLTADFRKKTGRMEFVRARLQWQGDGLVATPTAGQGSHMLGGLAQADCLIHVPLETERLSAGDRVTVEPISWSAFDR
jgi:molybdopterin molybdotransferase